MSLSLIGARAQRARLPAALMAATFLGTVSAHAQSSTWDGSGGSSWNNADSWTAGVPLANGTAIFTGASPTTIDLTANVTVGTVQFDAGAPIYTFDLGARTFEFTGAGIVNNSSNAPIFNNGGLLQFSGTSSAGNMIRNNTPSATTFTEFSTAGTGRFTQDGGGLLSFTDNSNAGNATIITNFGLTQFAADSSAANANIIVNAFGAVIFQDNASAQNATITINNGGTAAFAGTSTGGDARFIVAAGGELTLIGLSGAFTGFTAGSIEGAGTICLCNHLLTVGSNNMSTEFSGTIQQGGPAGTPSALTKVGTGTLTLSGVSNYLGATTVNGGALIVNGSIVSSSGVVVNAGGTIGGNGLLPSTTINGGTLAPGNSIGTLTIQGNLVLTAASSYIVEVSPTNADRTNVTGTATLGGTVQAVFQPGSYVTRSYTILHADGGLGGTTFNGLTIVPPGFTADLSYTATDVLLNLKASLGTPGLTVNQQNVANAINGFFNNGGALPPNFLPLFGLAGGNLANALTLMSGEVATGAQQGAFKLMDQFLALMLDPFVDGRSGTGGAGGPAMAFAPEREEIPNDIALAYAKVTKTPVYKAPAYAPSFEQRWTVWGGAFGGTNKTGGDPAVVGSHDLTARTGGFAAGLDYRVAPGTVVGFALAGGGTNWGLANGLGTGKSDTFQAGLYGSTRWGALQVSASLAYAWHDVSTDRFAFAGNHLGADFDAHSLGARVEAGYRMTTVLGGLTPYAAVQAQSFRTPSYLEADLNNGGFGLAYNSRTGTATRSELGARADRLFVVDRNAVLALRGRLAWGHDWVSDPALTAGFQTLPGASFIVNGATPAKNLALVSAGAELQLATGVTLSGKFDGEFAERSTTYAGTGTIRYRW